MGISDSNLQKKGCVIPELIHLGHFSSLSVTNNYHRYSHYYSKDRKTHIQNFLKVIYQKKV